MWKNALSATAAALCLAAPVVAAEGSRLSVPNLETRSESGTSASVAPTLRPARISIAEAPGGTEPAARGAARAASSSQRPTQIKTTPPMEVATRKPVEKKPLTSSRRTAAAETSDATDKKITFHPVEVMPLKDDSRRAARSQASAPVGEVQYPVMPSDSLAGESTAEYEEDYAPIVSSEPKENFAPIISAADMPRPGSVRRTAASENRTPPDVSLPPLTPMPSAAPAAQQPEEKPAGREPARLSSILKGGLRLPEFRSRPAREDSGR